MSSTEVQDLRVIACQVTRLLSWIAVRHGFVSIQRSACLPWIKVLLLVSNAENWYSSNEQGERDVGIRSMLRVHWSMKLLYGLSVLLIVMVVGCACQDRLVYHPHPYAFARSAVPGSVRPIAFATSQGMQQAFFVPPRSEQLATLWIFFPGNGSTALDWLRWIKQYPDASTGFLLIDYPGYGFSEGHPSAEAILETSEIAFAKLAQSLGTDPARLWRKTSVLGHSLGAATALQFATRHLPPQRIVLVSPFTSLRAISQRTLGAWVGPLVRNDYDNLARMKELENRHVEVHVIHGSADEVIPVDLARELGRAYAWIRYHEVSGAHHNDMFDLGREVILQSMGQGTPHL